jgi:ribosomal-protein-alanine N-acetyltransferase
VDFSIRESRPEDLETLWRIDQQCFAPGISYSRIELATYMRGRGTLTLVAEADPGGGREAEAVGYIVAHGGRAGMGHIITIDVLEPARRAGVGSRLLSAAEGRLRAVGCRGVYLETAVDNHPAIRFYKRHSYSLGKTIPGYYSNGADAFVMVKELISPFPGR